jgi:hypothetical protein
MSKYSVFSSEMGYAPPPPYGAVPPPPYGGGYGMAPPPPYGAYGAPPPPRRPGIIGRIVEGFRGRPAAPAYGRPPAPTSWSRQLWENNQRNGGDGTPYMQSFERWQEVHSGQANNTQDDYNKWRSTYGQYGATINGELDEE